MEPARTIISLFGGNKALAELLGLHVTRVAFWKQPRPRGSGGLIPRRHWATLIRLGAERGLTLTPVSFVEKLEIATNLNDRRHNSDAAA